MVGWRGTGRERGGAYAFAPERPSAVSMLGWVGHRNGDRDCEPAELTEHQARDGGKLGRASPAYRAPEPRHGRPMAGFCYTRKGQDAERLGVSTAVATSAQAITPAPIPQSDGMITQVRFGCGAGRTLVAGHCVARTTIRHTRRVIRRGYY